MGGTFPEPKVDVSAVDQVVGSSEHRAIARRTAREAVTLLRKQGLPLEKASKILIVSSAQWNDLGPAHPDSNDVLLSELRKRSPGSEIVILDEKGENWGNVLREARTAEQIILAISTKIRSNRAEGVQANERLLSLANEIAALGKHTSLLGLGNPYALKDFPDTDVGLCTYSNCPDSVAAAVETLYLELKPKGRLPVRISEEYPYGFGL